MSALGPSKCRETPKDSVVSRKNWIFNYTRVKTSNLAKLLVPQRSTLKLVLVVKLVQQFCCVVPTAFHWCCTLQQLHTAHTAILSLCALDRNCPCHCVPNTCFLLQIYKKEILFSSFCYQQNGCRCLQWPCSSIAVALSACRLLQYKNFLQPWRPAKLSHHWTLFVLEQLKNPAVK